MNKFKSDPLLLIRDANRWHEDLHAALRQQRIKRQQLAELLGYSKDALGRRLRGDTPWTITDYTLLNEYLDLVPIGQTGHLRFAPLPNLQNNQSFEPHTYLATLDELALICRRHAYALTVTTSDLPIFYFLSDPMLAKCKLMLFATVGNTQVVKRAQRANMRHFEQYVSKCRQLAHHFSSIRRREIWGPDPLRSFAHQVERLAAAGHLKQVDLGSIADAMQQLVDRLEELQDHGLWKLRCDQERSVSSTYCLRNEQTTSRVFVSLDNPYFVHAQDHQTCRLLSKQFESTWTQSSIVTEHAVAKSTYFDQVRTATKRRGDRLRML